MVSEGKLRKLILSKVNKSEDQLKNLYIVPIQVKGQLALSFTYRYPTQDQVKNYPMQEALVLLSDFLGATFLQALLVGADLECQLLMSKKGKCKLLKKNLSVEVSSSTHNKVNLVTFAD